MGPFAEIIAKRRAIPAIRHARGAQPAPNISPLAQWTSIQQMTQLAYSAQFRRNSSAIGTP